MLRIFLALSVLALMACTPRGEVTLDPAAATVGQVQRVFIGTTRGQNDDGSFGNKRSEAVRFARYDISVPPDRKLGQITWPPRHGAINPEKQFLTTDELIYQADVAFRADLKTQLAARGGEAVIFVHGYNNNFAEGVYRVAQFAHRRVDAAAHVGGLVEVTGRAGQGEVGRGELGAAIKCQVSVVAAAVVSDATSFVEVELDLQPGCARQ
mgnify:CR=1 FL=1